MSEHLLAAIANAADEMLLCGEDPHSDSWVSTSLGRSKLRRRVRRRWCDLTGSHATQFPFSEQDVCERWKAEVFTRTGG